MEEIPLPIYKIIPGIRNPFNVPSLSCSHSLYHSVWSGEAEMLITRIQGLQYLVIKFSSTFAGVRKLSGNMLT